ncbi:MAG: hypothetical protein Q9M13_00770 [Mariprofundales bacterium]|nr:hypothetical protein [Mariprofundales bacterium]
MAGSAVVTGGLVQVDGQWHLHPDLQPWRSTLLRRRQRWFDAELHNPLSLLAAVVRVAAAQLLVRDADGAQYWVVTPWHGQAVRDRVRLLPSSLFAWNRRDADWLRSLLQPLLVDLEMELLVLSGGALVMRCAHPLAVDPLPYPLLEANGLTNRHPDGEDGGRLMRLLSEVQMLLHQQHSPHRGDQHAIHGIWLWGGWQSAQPVRELSLPRIACRDRHLRHICDGRDPQWWIGGAEEMVEMLPYGDSLPAIVVLTGGGRAVLFAGRRWNPFANRGLHEDALTGGEALLWQQLRGRDAL